MSHKICVLAIQSSHCVDRTIPLLDSNYFVFFIVDKYFAYLDKLKNYENVKIFYLNEIVNDKKQKRLFTLIKLLKDINPELIIVHFAGYLNFHAAVFSGIKPIVSVLMGSDVNVRNSSIPFYVKLELLFTRNFLPFIELLAAKTNEIKEQVFRLKPKGKCVTIPWGIKIDDKSFILSEKEINKLRSEFGLNSNTFVVFSPRGMIKLHRHLEIVEGFAEFNKKNKDSILILIKFNLDADYLKDILDKINRLGLKDNVKIIDAVGKSEMYYYYSISDVVISNSIHDGMPQTLFEAALFYNAFILSALDQYKEYLPEDKAAIYTNGTPSEISKTLNNLREDSEKLSELKTNSRKEVLEKANFEEWSSKFINELNEIISSSNIIKIPKLRIIVGYLLFILIAIMRKSPFNKIQVKV